MHRETLIAIAHELRGMAGVSIVRRHLREATHEALRAGLPLVLKVEWRCDE